MADVRVKITTEADLASVTKTGEQFQKLETQASKTKEAFEKLSSVSGKSAAESAKVFQEAARGRQDAADAAGALGDMTREAKGFSGEVEQKVEPALQRMAKGFKDLGREIPVVGVAIRALANPWTFVGAAVAGAFVWFQRMISVQNELARSGAELAARLDPVIVNQVRLKQVLAESAIAADDFNRKLGAEAEALGKVREGLRNVNQQLDERKRLEEAILEADKKLALAKAGDDPAAQAAVEADFAGRARELQSRDNIRRIVAADKARRETRDLGLEAGAALPGARADLEQARLEAGQETDSIDAALGLKKDEGEALRKELAEAIQGIPAKHRGLPGLGESAQARERRVRRQLAENAQATDALQARRSRVQAGVVPFAERVAGLERNVEGAQQALPGLQSEFNRLAGKANTDRAIEEATHGTLEEARKLVTTQAELKEALKQTAELQRKAAREQAEVNRELRSIIKSNHGR